MKTPWTPLLRAAFVGLQLSGLYLLTVFAFLLTIVWWGFINLVGAIFNKPSSSYWDTTTALLGAVLGDLQTQPWILVGVVAALLASVVLTYGAIRTTAWAHWGAMVFIALSIAPPVLWRPLHDALGVMAWVYLAACLAFLAAMTYAGIRYGPWGMTKPMAPARHSASP